MKGWREGGRNKIILERIYEIPYIRFMKIKKIYRCLCDETRLRILNLLLEGPLCVCHLAEILELSQPKVSRHLKALREAGALETERCYNWTICRIPAERNRLLEANLKCLQDLRREEPQFTLDLEQRARMLDTMVPARGEALPERIRSLAESCR